MLYLLITQDPWFIRVLHPTLPCRVESGAAIIIVSAVERCVLDDAADAAGGIAQVDEMDDTVR
jgi:hypothetical protein